MKPAKKWKSGPPDLDWDDKLNALKGLQLIGVESTGAEFVLKFKGGRQFTVCGDGQRHEYQLDGKALGKLEGVEAIKCVQLSPCHGQYVSRISAGGSSLTVTVDRKSDEPPSDGFKFKMTSQRVKGDDKHEGKNKPLAFRVR